MTTCPDCGHPLSEHSSEAGVGCVHVDHNAQAPYQAGKAGLSGRYNLRCSCLRPGTSQADQ